MQQGKNHNRLRESAGCRSDKQSTCHRQLAQNNY